MLLTLIAVLAGAAALFALLTWLSVRRYHKTAETEGLRTIHGVNRNGRDPSVVSILDQTGDEVDDAFGPDSFR